MCTNRRTSVAAARVWTRRRICTMVSERPILHVRSYTQCRWYAFLHTRIYLCQRLCLLVLNARCVLLCLAHTQDSRICMSAAPGLRTYTGVPYVLAYTDLPNLATPPFDLQRNRVPLTVSDMSSYMDGLDFDCLYKHIISAFMIDTCFHA